MIILVMGVAGSGKTTIGQALGTVYRLPFLDADQFHPPANIAKMKAGSPLNDADRQPWLERLNQELTRREAKGPGAVLACSALKASYREILLHGLDTPTARGPYTVFLKGSEELIDARMKARKDHFMPPTLLASQFATLEAPEASAKVFVIDVGPTPEQIIEDVKKRIGV